MQLQDYLNNLRALIHDTNSSDFTDQTLTVFINQARNRVAMDTHCVRQFYSVTGGNVLNTIGGQENYSYNGTIGGISLTAPGNNLYTNPTVTITNAAGDTTGSGATATAVVASGVIQNIFMTNWGSNYTAQPTVSITDATGSGATASATFLNNIFDIIAIDVLWGAERLQHGYLPFNAFQTLCRSLIQEQDVPSLFTLNKGIQQTFLFQVPDQAYVMEWDALALPNAFTVGGANTQVDTQILAPWNDAVQWFAAFLCYTSLNQFQKANFFYTGQKQKPGIYDSRVMQLASSLQSHRVYNPYRTYLKRWRRM